MKVTPAARAGEGLSAVPRHLSQTLKAPVELRIPLACFVVVVFAKWRKGAGVLGQNEQGVK